MTVKNGDMPAMPVFPDTETGHASAFKGLTKREHTVIAMLQGILASPTYEKHCCANDEKGHPVGAVRSAIRMTDLLLAELERTK